MLISDLMIRVAWQYYYENRSQREIAKLFGLSRQKVQRLLRKARDEGLVRISISNRACNLLSMERDLCEKYGIEDAVVVPIVQYSEKEIREALAFAAADYLTVNLEKIKLLGVGMGKTLSYLPNFFNINMGFKGKMKIVSLAGNLMGNYSWNPMSIGMKLSEKLGVPFYGLWTPFKVDSIEAAEMIRKQEPVAQVLRMVEKVEVSVIGIGGPISEESFQFRKRMFSEDEILFLRKIKAAGDILGRWFDADGKLVFEELNKKIIGSPVKTPGKTIAVAGGLHKIDAIKGALRGKLIDVLITDERVAEHVLTHA
ncbi:MAG: winged helix-turn-helix transcriptional regulator [Thermotogaceae bacterium]|nr:winged helix-turn-helix transcriptional regulator [Thermotogaceae bacterium]